MNRLEDLAGWTFSDIVEIARRPKRKILAFKPLVLSIVIVVFSITIVVAPQLKPFEIKIVSSLVQLSPISELLTWLEGRFDVSLASRIISFSPWLFGIVAYFVLGHILMSFYDFKLEDFHDNNSKIRGLWWEGTWWWVSSQLRNPFDGMIEFVEDNIGKERKEGLEDEDTERGERIQNLIKDCRHATRTRFFHRKRHEPEYQIVEIIADFDEDFWWGVACGDMFPSTSSYPHVKVGKNTYDWDLPEWVEHFAYWIIFRKAVDVAGIHRDVTRNIKPQEDFLNETKNTIIKVLKLSLKAVKLRNNLEGYEKRSKNEERWYDEDIALLFQYLETIEKSVGDLNDLRIQFVRFGLRESGVSDDYNSITNGIRSINEALDEVMELDSHHNNKIESLMPIGATV
jgi:hypothetical protein